MTAVESSALVTALLALPGVAGASLVGVDASAADAAPNGVPDAVDRLADRDADGAGHGVAPGGDFDAGGRAVLRLWLTGTADEVAVATSVNRLLREQFGLTVDAQSVELLAARPTARVVASVVPAATTRPTPAAGRPADPPPQHRVGRRRRPAAGADAAADVETRVAAPAPGAGVDRAVKGRLAIDRVQLRVSGLDASAVVWLRTGAEASVGEHRGVATETGVLRTVAAATLRAVEASAPGRVRFDVEHVDVTDTGAQRTAVCVVSMLTGSGSQLLPGASVVRGDVRHAVVRATLAAVNRQVERLLEDG